MTWKKGLEAEAFVASILQELGWTILARNYRRKGFEIDLIVGRLDRLICVEVKARLSRRVSGAELISQRKRERLIRGMKYWLCHEAYGDQNPEFWLCITHLPLGESRLQWLKMEVEEATKPRSIH